MIKLIQDWQKCNQKGHFESWSLIASWNLFYDKSCIFFKRMSNLKLKSGISKLFVLFTGYWPKMENLKFWLWLVNLELEKLSLPNWSLSIWQLSTRSGSCHFDRVSNDEFSVKFWIFGIVMFLTAVEFWNLGYLQGIIKVL